MTRIRWYRLAAWPATLAVRCLPKSITYLKVSAKLQKHSKPLVLTLPVLLLPHTKGSSFHASCTQWCKLSIDVVASYHFNTLFTRNCYSSTPNKWALDLQLWGAHAIIFKYTTQNKWLTIKNHNQIYKWK